MNIELIEALKKDEGLRLFPYKCTAGKLTIGIGRNLEDVGITEDEAVVLLLNDIKKATIDSERIVKNFYNLDQVRQNVITNMMFNLGLTRFSKFTNTIKAINNFNFTKASEEMKDSSWFNQVGSRAIRLCEEMKTGVAK